MSAYEGMAYRYSFTTPAAFDISAPGVLVFHVKRVSDNVVVDWTPVIDGANACHYDSGAGDLVAGHYQGIYEWRETGAGDTPQYGRPFQFEVKALWAA